MSDSLTKHTLNLRKGDFDQLKAMYPEIGAAAIIRKVVSKYVDSMDRPITEEELKSVTIEVLS